MREFTWRYWLKVVLIAIAYYVTARLGLLLAVIPAGKVTAIWAPSGIAFAAVMLMGKRAWPGIWLGALASSIAGGDPLLLAVSLASGNTLEALAGVWLLQRLMGERSPFSRLKSVFRFFLAAGGACVVAATLGILSLALSGLVPWPLFMNVWLTWWVGDMGGILIVTPLILAWSQPPPDVRLPGGIWESFLLYLATVLLGGVVLGSGLPLQTGGPMSYLFLILMLWSSFRYGLRQTTTVIFLICIIAIWGVIRGVGPFSVGEVNINLLEEQVFMVILTMTGLALSAIMRERRGVEEALRKARDRLEERVKERTNELSQINASLEEEVREHLRAERALQDSEKRYQSLFEDSPISLKEEDFSQVKKALDELRQAGVTDLAAYFKQHPEAVRKLSAMVRIVDINKATVQLYGARDKTELLTSLERIFGQGSYDPFEVQLLNIFNGVKQFDIETVNYTFSGEPINIHLRWAAAPGYEDTLSKVFISTLDVTQARRSAEALRQSQEMLQLVMDNIPQAVFWKDRNSVYQGGNRAQLRLAGLSDLGELIGKTDRELTWGQSADIYVDGDRRVMESDTPLYHQIEMMKTSRGELYWAEVSKIPMHNQAGDVTGVMGTWENITERVKAEEERIASERKFRKFFEQAHDGIALINQKGEITDWNRGIEEISGYAAHEIVGRKVWEINAMLTPDEGAEPLVFERARQMFQELEESGHMAGENQVLELEIVRKDGEKRTIQSLFFSPLTRGRK